MIISNTRYNTAVGQHYDNCKIDSNGKIIRNHSAFRTFTATVSLTNDFLVVYILLKVEMIKNS